MPVDARPTVAAPDDDPYVWLEEVDGVRALGWVDKQNAATLARFGGADFTADRDTLAAIYDRPDNIPYVTRRGPHLYNFWKDAQNPRGLWRRTTLDSFRTQQPQWKIVLDLDELAAREREDWIWGGSSTLPGTHNRAIIRLSRGGGDAVVLREFDIPTQVFLRDGWTYPPDTMLGLSLAAFLAGDRNFTVLFEPGERRALQSFFWSNGQLVLSILDELQPVFEVLTPSVAGWARSKIAGLPEIGVVHIWRVDIEEAESNGDLFANVQNPIIPSSLRLMEAAQKSDGDQAGAFHIFHGRTRSHAPRSALHRRRTHSIRAGRTRRTYRRRARSSIRLWWIRESRRFRTTTRRSASFGWSVAGPA